MLKRENKKKGRNEDDKKKTTEMRKAARAGGRFETQETQAKHPSGAQTQYLFQIDPLLEVICHWQAQVLALAWEPMGKARENKLGTPTSQVQSLKLGGPTQSLETNRPQKANPLATGPAPPEKRAPPPAPWTPCSRPSPQTQM